MARMLDFRERTQLRKAMYAKPTILVLGVIGALIAHGAWGMYQKSIEAKEKRDKAIAEYNELTTYEGQLEADIRELSTPRGQEEKIRDRFMVAREGEKVIVVTDPEKDATHTVTVNNDETPGMVEKLKASIGGLDP